MARDVTDDAPVTSRTQLVEWFAAGCKPASAFRLGTEHEKFAFYRRDLTPTPYEGEGGRGGIRTLLEGMRDALGWEPIEDHGALIGLAEPNLGAAISLEPGGQFELSGAPLETVHQTAAELHDHLRRANDIASRHGIGFLGLGMTPLWTRDEIPTMPKSRYRIMMNYMPRVGTRGLDMMLRTCTVQVNLDYSSESDMLKKLRVSLALQPMTIALFANSPFTDGQPNGFLSMRSEIWRHTDKARTGMLPFAFEEGAGFQQYVDYALDVPMYFVKRGAQYHDVAGASFRDLLAGRLPQLPHERATIADWANHLSTIFPEVRLKRFLEIRGADVGNPAQMLALPALFAGLLYDPLSLDSAWELIRDVTPQELERARDEAPRLGLETVMAGRPIREIARDALALSRAGLQRRARQDEFGRDETVFLDVLDLCVERGRSPAQDWLARYHGEWRGSVLPIFEEAAL
jgi:glutamate--cysteine ligase